MSGRPIHACRLEATPVAVVRSAMPPDRIARWLPKAYRLVGSRLAAVGIAVAGPAFALYTAVGDVVEVEAGFPVATAVQADGVVVPSGLPGGAAAVTVHEGPLAVLDDAYRCIDGWLGARGFTALGRHWERYLVGGVTNEPDPSRWRTEVVVPYGRPRLVLAAARSPVAAGTHCVDQGRHAERTHELFRESSLINARGLDRVGPNGPDASVGAGPGWEA